MFDKDAIQLLAQAESISAAATAVDGAVGSKFSAGTVALPSDFTVHDLEKKLQMRRRARGVMTTSSVAPFAEYVGVHKEPGAAVFVDQDAMTAERDRAINVATGNGASISVDDWKFDTWQKGTDFAPDQY